MTSIISKELHFAKMFHRYVSYDSQTKYPLGYFPQQHSHVGPYNVQTGAFCEVGTNYSIIIRIIFCLA